MQRERRDLHVAEPDGRTLNLFKLHVRREQVEAHRKVGIRHLPAQHVAQVLCRTRGVESDGDLRRVERREEWQPLQVVPVKMGEKDMQFTLLICLRRAGEAKVANAGPRIEDEAFSARNLY